MFHDIAQLTLRFDGTNDTALDKAQRARVALESYIDMVERALTEPSLRLDDASKATLGDVIRRTSSWIDTNADAATEEWEKSAAPVDAVRLVDVRDSALYFLARKNHKMHIAHLSKSPNP